MNMSITQWSFNTQHRQRPAGVDVMDSGLVPAKSAGRCGPWIARVGLHFEARVNARSCLRAFASSSSSAWAIPPSWPDQSIRALGVAGSVMAVSDSAGCDWGRGDGYDCLARLAPTARGGLRQRHACDAALGTKNIMEAKVSTSLATGVRTRQRPHNISPCTAATTSSVAERD